MALVLNHSCKRLLAPYADLLEPAPKRGCAAGGEDDHGDNVAPFSSFAYGIDCRGRHVLDDIQDFSLEQPVPKRRCTAGAEEDHLDSSASASSFARSVDCRRQRHLEDLQDFAPEQPTEKRPRFDAGPADAAGMPELGAHGAGDRDVAIRGWGEALVKALQNCPSVEEATQRCVRILSDFESEVQQVAVREGDVAEAASESAVQSLQHTKKVLMKAISHLAQRCRGLQASNGEVEELRDALAKSQEAQRRLAHHNEILKGHLRLASDFSTTGGGPGSLNMVM